MCALRATSDSLAVTKSMSANTPSMLTVLAHPTNNEVVFVAYPRLFTRIKALSRTTMQTIWRRNVKSPTSNSVSMAICPRVPNILYVAAGGCVHALDMENGFLV